MFAKISQVKNRLSVHSLNPSVFLALPFEHWNPIWGQFGDTRCFHDLGCVFGDLNVFRVWFFVLDRLREPTNHGLPRCHILLCVGCSVAPPHTRAHAPDSSGCGLYSVQHSHSTHTLCHVRKLTHTPNDGLVPHYPCQHHSLPCTQHSSPLIHFTSYYIRTCHHCRCGLGFYLTPFDGSDNDKPCFGDYYLFLLLYCILHD